MELTAVEWLKIKHWLMRLSEQDEKMAQNTEISVFKKIMSSEAREIKAFLASKTK